MFIEPSLTGERRGWIEVICGSMFSGKTEELIRRLKRVQIAHLKAEVFKPAIDTRYSETDVVSHDENTIQSTPVDSAQHILLLAQDADVIGLDEAQFFDPEIVHVCELLAAKGVRVIVAGLDMDFKGKPFGPMPQLLAIADYITKLHAICVKCGNIASISYRTAGGSAQVLLGEKQQYEPRCRKCYLEGVQAQNNLNTTDKK
ncbi:thymidine kinase [Arachidicoccus ginsenosidivorans]|jgi:thymidine kinase|uniref:Thymidine kinase n=1 Tax=Arachidicoccus ginsenosidivorans TaxID=496057 RepID=A0A5B8VPX5_9BACT|nr:thymidine kinase [Arachidicoccus ginsenosidivorans]QEC72645.1 thymidine kinase [Arachidicoccus ginsenosidivorans]